MDLGGIQRVPAFVGDGHFTVRFVVYGRCRSVEHYEAPCGPIPCPLHPFTEVSYSHLIPLNRYDMALGVL